MTDLLPDLADAARLSGLRVVELKGWATNFSAGAFDPTGVLCHHTGSFDDIADKENDLDYAEWLAFTGRTDLDPPLCNFALSAECVVYVCAAGNANHAGEARSTGPMPAASDGNALYIGIEAMNSGSQGWDSKGLDTSGQEITQRTAYARLCAALCEHYDWPASHVRGHKETSSTGKWDPGLLDMDDFRSDVAREIRGMGDDMPLNADDKKWIKDTVEAAIKPVDDVVRAKLTRANESLREANRRLKELGQEPEPES